MSGVTLKVEKLAGVPENRNHFLERVLVEERLLELPELALVEDRLVLAFSWEVKTQRVSSTISSILDLYTFWSQVYFWMWT